MREIKFRAWYGEQDRYFYFFIGQGSGCFQETYDRLCLNGVHFEQFTGLRDKNGLTEIYEGDILSEEGVAYANIHEGSVKSGLDLLIAKMGTNSWRSTEQEAIKRGCFYAE